MENRKAESQFREDEIVFIKHFDKQRQEWVVNPHPKVGGRLRLAHEGNEALSIETDIVKYDGSTAVVSAVVSAAKGRFKGIGMASVERDKTLGREPDQADDRRRHHFCAFSPPGVVRL